MFRFSVGLLAFASFSFAGTNTYTIGGVGSGYWGAQPFTEATFTFTFTAETSTFVHSTPCCERLYTTPAGTPAQVSVSGFPAATLTGDQAIFTNNAGSTAGIWHYNDPEYLTIVNPQFATNDLSVPMGGYLATGPSYAYVTPMPLSTGGSLYFTSVHDVYLYAQAGAASGQPSAVSVTPNSGAIFANSTKTFSFTVSDTAGASDIGGLNILFQDSPNLPAACWLYYQVSTATIGVWRNGAWSAPARTQNSTTLAGDACAVDPAAAQVSLSGNNLTLTLPITLTSADNNTWSIYLNAINKAGTSSGYARVGAVTAAAASFGAPNFTLSLSPQGVRGVALGQSLSYTVNVTPSGGFSQPVSFSTTTTAGHAGNTAQLSATFNPPTVTGSGSTTMTVSTPAGAPADIYRVFVTGASQSLSASASTGPIEASNAPPAVSISPNTGAGSAQTFTIRMTDRIDIAGVNLLIAPSLAGANACWIFFDGSAIYLAADDGASWIRAGTLGAGSASNSQCSVDLTGASYDHGSTANSAKSLRIPVAFTGAFAGTKTLFVRANNVAGFDTGYRPLGAWSVP